MLFYISDAPQEFKVNPFAKCTFDGRILNTIFNDQIVDSVEAKIGTAFYAQAQGKKKAPIITFPEMPKARGEKIAWALSFIGNDKYVSSESEFYKRYNTLVKNDLITNIALFTKYRRFAVIIADRHIKNEDPTKNKVKKDNPIMAWISDDITREELNSLLDKIESRKKLPCPRNFFFAL